MHYPPHKRKLFKKRQRKNQAGICSQNSTKSDIEQPLSQSKRSFVLSDLLNLQNLLLSILFFSTLLPALLFITYFEN